MDWGQARGFYNILADLEVVLHHVSTTTSVGAFGSIKFGFCVYDDELMLRCDDDDDYILSLFIIIIY